MSLDLAEEEVAEITRRYKSCLRYGAFNEQTRAVVEGIRQAYMRLWAILILYFVSWFILSTRSSV